MGKNRFNNNLTEHLVNKIASGINLQNFIEDYAETVSDLMTAHDICCHYTNMSELDERHQGAIDTLWKVIEAILKAGYENMNVAKE
jgi:ABC-type Fe3+-citrate transport system substrate-binding protein